MSFQFHTSEGQELTLESAVFQAIGAASMCWEQGGQGMFKADKAKEIGDTLIVYVQDLLARERKNTKQYRDALGDTFEELEKVRRELRRLRAGNDWTSYI